MNRIAPSGSEEAAVIQFPVEVETEPASNKDDPLKDVKSQIEYRWERVTHEGMLDLSQKRPPLLGRGVLNPQVFDRPGFIAKWRRISG